MARFTLEIDDAIVPLVLAAIGYTATVENDAGEMIPNPLTPLAYFHRWLADELRRAVRKHLIAQTRATARTDLIAAISDATAEADALVVK